jgi:hypothetical protein
VIKAGLTGRFCALWLHARKSRAMARQSASHTLPCHPLLEPQSGAREGDRAVPFMQRGADPACITLTAGSPSRRCAPPGMTRTGVRDGAGFVRDVAASEPPLPLPPCGGDGPEGQRGVRDAERVVPCEANPRPIASRAVNAAASPPSPALPHQGGEGAACFVGDVAANAHADGAAR